MLYRVEVQETYKSKKHSVHENLDRRGMLHLFYMYKDAFKLKIYHSMDGSFWHIEKNYIHGYEVLKMPLNQQKEPFSMLKLFKQLSNIATFRKPRRPKA